MIRRLLQFLASLAALAGLGLAVLVVVGFFGALHPVLDAFSHFRLHFAAAMAVAALFLAFFAGRRLQAALMISVALLATAMTLGLPWQQNDGVRAADASMIAGSGSARYRLLQLNLRYDNPHPEEVLSLVGRLEPDVITFEEVSQHWLPKLELLRARYPYSLVCEAPSFSTGGVAILSRRPFAAAPHCLPGKTLAIAAIDFGGRRADVAAMHLGWPIVYRQHRQLERYAGDLSDLGRTAILAGDLNAVAWSDTARRVASYGRLKPAGRVGPTWLWRRLPDWLRPWIGLPIDHVFVKGAVLPLSLERLGNVGSDHLPLMLEFTVLPEEQPAQVLKASL